MNPTRLKYRLIFRPFLLVFIVYLLIYTTLYWWFFIANEYFHFKEDAAKLVFNTLTAWIPVWIWVRPRFKKHLVFNTGRRSESATSYALIVTLTMIITTAAAVNAANTVMGNITTLNTIDEIYERGASKFYTVQNLYIDKTDAAEVYTTTTSGRRSTNLNMYLNVAFPLFARAEDTTRVNCPAWICFEYSKTVSNRLSVEEKGYEKKAFIQSSWQDLYAIPLEKFQYLERVGYTDEFERTAGAIAQANKFAQPGPQLLHAVNESYSGKDLKPLLLVLACIAGSCLVVTFMIWIRNLKPTSRQSI